MMAIQRITKELAACHKQPSRLWMAEPENDNMFCWRGVIRNIPNYRHDDMEYKIRIEFPNSYPFKPPKFTFLSDINSRYVHHGNICIDILKKAWSPALTIDAVINGLCSLLADEHELVYKRIRPIDDDAEMESLAKRMKNM